MGFFPMNDPDARKNMRAMHAMMGPQHVDEHVRRAIQTCWMMMPEGQQTPEAVAAEIRRIVERALKDLADDARAFGLDQPVAPDTPS